jgi:integrase
MTETGKGAPTMLEAFETHLVARRRSPNTIRIRMIYLRQLAARHELSEATTRDLESFLVSHPEWKPETVNCAIASWSVFYKWAIRSDVLTNDPTYYLERAQVIRQVKVLADDDLIRSALEVATPRERAILLLGREGGLRRLEIASLHRKDRAGDWLTIVGKGRRVRRIHLTPDMVVALDAIESDGYYFPGRGAPHISVTSVYRVTMTLIGTAPHSLRRSALTAVYRRSGNNIRMAQEFAGHASPNTTAGYIQVNEADLISAGGFASLAA